MKKILAIVLAVLMLIGTMTFAETDQDILFMGIPWTLPAGEYLERIIDETGYSREDPISELDWLLIDHIYNPYDLQSYMEWMHENATNDVNQIDFGFKIYMLAEYMTEPHYKVAGYPILNIEGYSINDVRDGTVSNDPFQSHVIQMMYRIDMDRIADTGAVNEDLIDKLNRKYGNYSNQKIFKEEDSTSQQIVTVWIGKDSYVMLDTMISIIDSIDIIYGRNDFSALIECVKHPETTIQIAEPDPDDMSGL